MKNYTAAETRLIYIPVLERIIEDHFKEHRFLLSDELQQFIEEEKQKNGYIEGEMEVNNIDIP